MERPYAARSQTIVDLLGELVHRRRRGDVHPARPEVAGVQADSESRVAFEPIDDRRQLAHRSPDGPAATGAVLEQKVRRARRARQGGFDRPPNAPEGWRQRRVAVGPDVEYDVGIDLDGRRDGRQERVSRAPTEPAVEAREVDEIERVAEDVADARLSSAQSESLDGFRVVLGRSPPAGTLRK
jgi:hypothetical protein